MPLFNTTEPNLPGKLRVATVNSIYYIDVNDIVRIQSISNYSKLFFTSGKTLLVAKVLAHFDGLLTKEHFSRIHRTHLVNLSYVKQYRSGNINKISMSNDDVLPVSRKNKKILLQKMEMRSF